MAYTLRKDGRWGVYWVEGGKKRWVYFRSEDEARSYDAKRRAEIAVTLEVPTLGDLAILYLTKRRLHRDTQNHVKRCLKGAAAVFLSKMADQLNRRDLEVLRDYGRQEGLSNNSINKNQAYVAAILSWAVEQDLIQFNPWAGYRKLRVSRRIPTLTLEELGWIWDASPLWLRWAIEVAYCLWLRPGQTELFGLQWLAFKWSWVAWW